MILSVNKRSANVPKDILSCCSLFFLFKKSTTASPGSGTTWIVYCCEFMTMMIKRETLKPMTKMMSLTSIEHLSNLSDFNCDCIYNSSKNAWNFFFDYSCRFGDTVFDC